ncbi:MAG: biopolymer transporter ExbD [Methylococcales bacterium]
MKFQRKKREKVDITLVSMIDVLFVLLLFFMVSTTFNRPTQVKINLPEANGEQNDNIPKMVTLIINGDGVYYLEGEDKLPHELVNQKEETLKQELAKLARQTTDIPFVINADAKTPHQFVIRALDVAGQVGFTHITFAAQHSKAEQ